MKCTASVFHRESIIGSKKSKRSNTWDKGRSFLTAHILSATSSICKASIASVPVCHMSATEPCVCLSIATPTTIRFGINHR